MSQRTFGYLCRPTLSTTARFYSGPSTRLGTFYTSRTTLTTRYYGGKGDGKKLRPKKEKEEPKKKKEADKTEKTADDKGKGKGK